MQEKKVKTVFNPDLSTDQNDTGDKLHELTQMLLRKYILLNQIIKVPELY